ncbi:serine hydrolase domain-containing protein [Sphingomonas sabuli]|uniref:serine hydrolase domain-containing protein n=1 Tax=Sphingomonas sabuli TaxID=2764186 RepID=UPI001FE30FC0|nr:serine hydrolase domain-containing protein [Sphingomonas sabuli]
MPTTPRQGPESLSKEDVDAWLDGYMRYALGKNDIAGAVVTVVKDGQLLTKRGYGYADVASRKPVNPDLTLFRPGSVSKLITWTAVMQQVEQGKINLDADINQYLDFKIKPYRGQPVTMRQLMQHTAGFEEQIKDLIGSDRKGIPEYDELLKRWVPNRIFAPGTTPAYSNYGTSLAGYIVQRTSGENFYDYTDRHIFTPLKMNHSTMRQPLPAAFQPLMATGYKTASGDPLKFEIVGPSPAGSLSSTGTDMARFMIAHLNNGELDGQRILKPETARYMHTAVKLYVPPLDGMALGFFQTNVNGRRVIAHLGDTEGFHTSLHLFLDGNTGLYASFNSGGEEGGVNGVRVALFEQFADRYFPGKPDMNRVPKEQAKKHAEMMAGNWVASRRADSSFLNLTALIGQTKVSVDKDGNLVASGLSLSAAKPKWVETEPFVWHDLNSNQRLAAVVKDGKVQRFSGSIMSAFTVFERPAWYKNSALVMPLLQIAIGILLITAILWPVRHAVRRYHKAEFALTGRELLGYRLSRSAAVAILLVLVGWAALITVMFGELENTGGNLDTLVIIVQLLTFVAFLGGLAIFCWYAWQVWTGKRRWTAKVWSLALVFAGIVVVWVGFAFHMLSIGTNY